MGAEEERANCSRSRVVDERPRFNPRPMVDAQCSEGLH